MVRGWLVRKRRNLSVLPEIKDLLTTNEAGYNKKRTSSNGNEYKSIQELMVFILDKLLNSNLE